MNVMLAVSLPDRTAQPDIKMEVGSRDEGMAESDDTSANVVVDVSIKVPVGPSSGRNTATNSHSQKHLTQVPNSDASSSLSKRRCIARPSCPEGQYLSGVVSSVSSSHTLPVQHPGVTSSHVASSDTVS